jgi:hypothetical protein
MKTLRLSLVSLALVLAASLALSCGSNSTPGQLQSITISPAIATAGLPGQTVQFTATGHYTGAPFVVSPQPATWGACFQNAPTTAVSVTSSGVAQCEAAGGPVVEYSIFAFDQTNCNLLSACGGGCTIVGTAQLNCSGTAVDATLPQSAPNLHRLLDEQE